MKDTESHDQQETRGFIPPSRNNNRSFGDLLKDLSREVLTLVRQEAEMAKVEMSEKASRAARDTAFLMVGGAVTFAGFLALLMAAIYALTRFISFGWATLLVGTVVSGVGLLLLWLGRYKMKERDLLPRRTLESLKEDKERINRQLS